MHVLILAYLSLLCYNTEIPMQDVQEPKPAAETTPTMGESSVLKTVERLGVSVAIFGAVFLVIALAITMVVSPDRFPVRLGDSIVRLSELQAEEVKLKRMKGDLLEERQKLLQDSNVPVLHQVEKLRQDILPVGSVMLAIEDVRKSFKVGTSDPIALPDIQFQSDTGKLVLTGLVRERSGQSLQILASFVDGLRRIPLLESVTEPEYIQNTEDEWYVSPFTITLTLHHAS